VNDAEDITAQRDGDADIQGQPGFADLGTTRKDERALGKDAGDDPFDLLELLGAQVGC
jgi:hypothetical protein